MVKMELVGTIEGDGFLNKKYFYQCPKCKMLEIYSSSYDIPDPNECKRCKKKVKTYKTIKRSKRSITITKTKENNTEQ